MPHSCNLAAHVLSTWVDSGAHFFSPFHSSLVSIPGDVLRRDHMMFDPMLLTKAYVTGKLWSKQDLEVRKTRVDGAALR